MSDIYTNCDSRSENGSDIDSNSEPDQNINISRKRPNPFCINDSDDNSSDDYIDSEHYDEILDISRHKKTLKLKILLSFLNQIQVKVGYLMILIIQVAVIVLIILLLTMIQM